MRHNFISGGELSHFGFFTGGVFLGITCGTILTLGIQLAFAI